MTEAEKQWIKFEWDTNDALEEKGVTYRLIFLPEKDLMPYHHAKTTTQLENRVDELRDRMADTESEQESITLSAEEAEVLETALTVYKTALLAVHRKAMGHEPAVVEWEDEFGEGGIGYPKCPNCRELAYDLNEEGKGTCPFCGQRYYLDEEGKEKAKPNPEETVQCPMCGENTLVGRRAKSNGHFHGECKNCGSRIIE